MKTDRNFWQGRRVAVTGGAGFLGSHIVDKLRDRGCSQIIVPRSSEYDFVREDAVRRFYHECRPDIVIHGAALVGGIGANRERPGEFFHSNMAMGLHLVEYARHYKIDKFVCLGTICAYPKYAQIPFREEAIWDGYPEETNAPYGIAKKALLVMLDAYRQQYGLNGIYLLPVNLYGPRDNFDLRSSHVIPALIRKFVTAMEMDEREVVVWGTGSATREFLHVEDAAEGILLASERLDETTPVNLGAGFEISIRELAETIAELCGFQGDLVWDTSKPDGQPRRALDTSRAKELFGFEAQTHFRKGLMETIDWYRNVYRQTEVEAVAAG